MLIMRKNVKDLRDQIFGCNKVLHRVQAPRGTNAWWRIKCIYCGREKDEMGSRLKLPQYQSCMCRSKQLRGTKYRIENDIAIFTDSKGVDFFVDKEDIDLVAKYTWLVCTTTKGMQYVRCSYLNTTLHRFLLNPPKDMVVDHRNHNTLDNRRCNIWICTQSDNMYNQQRFHK